MQANDSYTSAQIVGSSPHTHCIWPQPDKWTFVINDERFSNRLIKFPLIQSLQFFSLLLPILHRLCFGYRAKKALVRLLLFQFSCIVSLFLLYFWNECMPPNHEFFKSKNECYLCLFEISSFYFANWIFSTKFLAFLSQTT